MKRYVPSVIVVPPPYRIRLAREGDLPAWREFLHAQLLENGRGGVFFAPRSSRSARAGNEAERLAERRLALARRLDEPGWLRVFLVDDGAGWIVGHADLTGGSLESELHRCRLGIGLREGHRRRGVGEALLSTAIEWARDAGLAWMDLGVFEPNPPAQALYRKLGFVEVGRTPDRFRIDGTSITDVLMALDLGRVATR
jgi:GNAT superfamily N-acetyltransferase